MKDKTPFLFILCGEAFSGKSTLARQITDRYEAEIVGRDRIYFALNSMLALEDTPENDDDALWKNLWPLAVQGVRNQLLLDKSVVFDDNCLYLSQREELRSVAKICNAQSILIYLNVPKAILQERKKRNKITNERHDVPSAWLEEDTGVFERPIQDEAPLTYDSDIETEKWFKRLHTILRGTE
jgi:predicted kinase